MGDSFQSVSFDVYGPKALACINGLPPALASRAIPISMIRAAADSPKPRRRIDAHPERWQALRDDLHIMALEHGPRWPELSQPSTVSTWRTINMVAYPKPSALSTLMARKHGASIGAKYAALQYDSNKYSKKTHPRLGRALQGTYMEV